MPRSPLLRRIFRLAADHEIAERHNVTPADVRAERDRRTAENTVTRRAFLRSIAAGGVAAGAALALGGGISEALAAPGARTTRIAIVGGGIAGLAAALTLRDARFEPVVYEASGRVGGRIFSDRSGRWGHGQVTEWCGELIDTGHETMLALAARFGLEVDDLLAAQPAGSRETYYFDGAHYPATQADADFKLIRPTLKAQLRAAGYPTTFDSNTPEGRALDDMSILEWIEAYVPGGIDSRLGRLLDVAYAIEYGAPSSDQSALNMLYLLGYQPSKTEFASFGESDEAFHIRGGNQQLPEAIAATLGSDLRLGRRLTSIAADGDVVHLTFQKAHGTEHVEADRVLLALPFSVLRHIDTSCAGFDPLKRRAICELGAAKNRKLNIQFGARLWDERGRAWGDGNASSFSDTGYEASWEATRAQPGAPGVLVGYGEGESSTGVSGQVQPFMHGNKINGYASRFLGQIEPVFPGLTALHNGKATLSIPSLDDNFKCSYAYYRVGQYQTFGGYEGVPQGNIHFAGEHTSPDFQGFMEGGASEGVRAAKEIKRAARA